jgi:hypothetical protein
MRFGKRGQSVNAPVSTDNGNTKSGKDLTELKGELSTFDKGDTTNEHTLIRLKGLVSQEPVTILFDPCATHNFVSTSLMDRLHLSGVADDQGKIEMGNGSFESSPENIKLPIHVSGYEDSIEFSIMHLSA